MKRLTRETSYFRQRLYEIHCGYEKRLNLNATSGKRLRAREYPWDETLDGNYPRLQDKERREAEAKAGRRSKRKGLAVEQRASGVDSDPEAV